MKRKRTAQITLNKHKSPGKRNLKSRFRMQKLRNRQVINRRIWFFENGQPNNNKGGVDSQQTENPFVYPQDIEKRTSNTDVLEAQV